MVAAVLAVGVAPVATDGVAARSRSVAGAAAGADTWVAVGTGGTIMSSHDDGVTWRARTSPWGSVTYREVAWGNGRWVAVAENGYIATSSDGVLWDRSTSGLVTGYPASSIYSVAHDGAGLWVAGAASAHVLTSPDGWTWTPARIEGWDSQSAVLGVHHADGRWVAVGAGSFCSDPAVVLLSGDGIDWTVHRRFSRSVIRDVTFSEQLGLWAIVVDGNTCDGAGDYHVYTSPDAVTWTHALEVDTFLSTIHWAAGWFVVPTEDGLLASRDGVTWSGDPVVQGRSAFRGTNRWTVVRDETLWTSDDLRTWTGRTVATVRPLLSVASTGRPPAGVEDSGPLPPVTLRLSSTPAPRRVGSRASVVANAAPAQASVGSRVAFDVVDGPNTGVRGVCTSSLVDPVDRAACRADLNGVVTWRYQGGPSAGTDTVRAFLDDDGDGSFDAGEASSTTTVTWREPIRYFAFGDSFSSGEGVEPFVSSSPCHRSASAYPQRVEAPGAFDTLPPTNWALSRLAAADGPGGDEFGFWACSGAVVANVQQGGVVQHLEPAQLDQLPSDGGELVTIGIGGNDAGFGSILKDCALHACLGDRNFRDGQNVSEWFYNRLPAVASSVRALFEEARAAAGADSSVVAVGYPYVFPATAAEQGCTALVPFRGEMDALRSMNHDLNEAIRTAAVTAGVHFVSLEESYAGREVCGREGEAINGAVVRPRWGIPPIAVDAASFHPKDVGHGLAAGAVNAFVAAWRRDGKPLTPAHLPRNPAPLAASAGNGAASAASGPGPATRATGGVTSPAVVSVRPAGHACAQPADTVVSGDALAVTGQGWAASSVVRLKVVSAAAGAIGVAEVTTDGSGAFASTVLAPGVAAPTIAGIEANGVDAAGAGTRASVLFELSGVAGPCADDDETSTTLGTPVDVAVLANDTGGPQSSTLRLLTAASHGTVTVLPGTGTVRYEPAGDATGTDRLVYEVCDGAGRCDTATVEVSIGLQCTIAGTDADDTLVGTAGDDVICGGEGDDVVDGAGGDDLVVGGAGTDTLLGRAGADRMYGGDGDDALNGGPGADVLDGGPGEDTVDDGDDTVPPVVTITTPAAGARYPVGATVTADFQCGDPGGGVRQCSGTVAPGATVATTRPGRFTFTVDAEDWAGNTSTAVVAYEVVPRTALVVANPASPSTTDAAVRDRLVTALGVPVVLVDDDAPAPAATTTDLVVIADSASPSRYGASYRASPLPVVTLSAGGWDELQLVAGTAGSARAGTAEVRDPAHPFVAGPAGTLTGTITYVTTAAATAYAETTQLPAGASPALSGAGRASRIVAFGVAAGRPLTTGSAPGNRAAIGWTGAVVANLTAAGWTVFDNAVAWSTRAP